MSQSRQGRDPVQVVVAADDSAAKKAVSNLVAKGSFEAVDSGPLFNARFLEPTGEMNTLRCFSWVGAPLPLLLGRRDSPLCVNRVDADRYPSPPAYPSERTCSGAGSTVAMVQELTIKSHASKSRRLRLRPEDEQSASAFLPRSRQSASGPYHSSLEMNCLRRELPCCYLPRWSNMSRSKLSCRRPFLGFRQEYPAIGRCVFGSI